jgi:hypothetical protein
MQTVPAPRAPSQPQPARKPRKKPARTIRLAIPVNADGRNGVVRITVGKESQDYFLSRIPSDFGAGFCLEKLGDEEGTAYQVNVSEGGRLCDCKGFCRWQRCKHADGLAALVKAGKL